MKAYILETNMVTPQPLAHSYNLPLARHTISLTEALHHQSTTTIRLVIPYVNSQAVPCWRIVLTGPSTARKAPRRYVLQHKEIIIIILLNVTVDSTFDWPYV